MPFVGVDCSLLLLLLLLLPLSFHFLTLSNPAMFLFSAKNSAGDFCCRLSALRGLGGMMIRWLSSTEVFFLLSLRLLSKKISSLLGAGLDAFSSLLKGKGGSSKAERGWKKKRERVASLAQFLSRHFFIFSSSLSLSLRDSLPLSSKKKKKKS